MKMSELLGKTDGTVIGELFEVIRTGKYAIPGESVGSKEELIRDAEGNPLVLSDLEKALYTVRNKYGEAVKEVNEIHAKNREAIEAVGRRCPECPFSERCLVLRVRGMIANSLSALMWGMIRARISSNDNNADNIGIRDGYVLVSFPYVDPLEAFMDMLKSMGLEGDAQVLDLGQIGMGEFSDLGVGDGIRVPGGFKGKPA